jgi:hypothetical protein
MSENRDLVHEYECDQCRHRYEVVMTFREQDHGDLDQEGQERPTGYPEQQPECPTCHSHEVVRVDIREKD